MFVHSFHNGINMSLRHLYRDLKSLKVYGDISEHRFPYRFIIDNDIIMKDDKIFSISYDMKVGNDTMRATRIVHTETFDILETTDGTLIGHRTSIARVNIPITRDVIIWILSMDEIHNLDEMMSRLKSMRM